MGPGAYPYKASIEFIKLINSAMDNARQRYDTIDPEEMVITHLAAHRGQISRGFRPRARGRASPKNHYQVNLEIFLEHLEKRKRKRISEGFYMAKQNTIRKTIHRNVERELVRSTY